MNALTVLKLLIAAVVSVSCLLVIPVANAFVRVKSDELVCLQSGKQPSTIAALEACQARTPKARV
ncbi:MULTISPECIES: hypothetical protein [Microvirgula]|uniref:Uncharacterized protein n=1 Tax=Microvirgula aerodenitrificans TaxID=57480 RepID=A0A2S0PCX1_9NEIS|nr:MULTISPECIES: hypothetical protein [Microvirgula]AVY95238.1 hypothetical protein DAI18_15220 [Microvirgula aerodenitrificans]RAS14995.1 hypothetical protein DFO50_10863 [Microvirgula sp. AG722]